MIEFIRKYILGGSDKNQNAPHILIVLCIYAIITSTYRAFYLDTYHTLMRIAVSIAVVASYIIFERIFLKKTIIALAVPLTIMGLIVFGSLHIDGDSLIFIYSIGAAIISLTYMELKSYARFIIISTIAYAVILIGFGVSLMGGAFSMLHNYLFFTASLFLKVILYFFFRLHLKILNKLTAAKNEADQAALAKGAFLSNISHEIRTPMNVIIGMTVIGKNSNDIERMRYSLDQINNAGTYLLNVINDVLDMSKIESGKFDLFLEEFKFKKIIEQAKSLVSLFAEEKKHCLTISVDDNIPPVLFGDSQRLVQVIANILGNAVKFTPERGNISLNACLLDEKGDLCTIQIEITDSGIGMSQEQQQNLYQPFSQADSNTFRKFGGTGLGLSISKNIVDMMSGEIRVQSEVGKGTTFTFTVRLRRAGISTAKEIPVEREAVTFYGKCAFIVEDVEINREIVTSLLEPTGIKIICAENGAEAVRMFSESADAYDIIFMDVNMPEMDGLEATRRIRSLNNARAKTVPIVAMTASVFREDIQKCLNAGMNGHIGKPLNADQIFGIMREYLGE